VSLMPKLHPKPCTKGGCTKYATKNSLCDDHQYKAWDHKGKSRHERGYGNDWEKARKNALLRDEYMCQECKKEGVYTRAVEVDHIKPKFLGGDNSLSNLSSLCHNCHLIKTKRESLNARKKVD